MVFKAPDEEISSELIDRFNDAPDDGRGVLLKKKDIELLINSLTELHRSYAELLSSPIVTEGLPRDRERAAVEHAELSYGLFSKLAARLMHGYLRENTPDE